MKDPHELGFLGGKVLEDGIDPLVCIGFHLELEDAVVGNDGYRSLEPEQAFFIVAQIASALNVVVQLERLSDGKRRLTSFSEITGMEGDVIQMQEIFRFKRISTDEDGKIHGEYVATGIRPKFMEELHTRGIEAPDGIFNPNFVLE